MAEQHAGGSAQHEPWDTGDEARKLVDAVTEWAQRALPAPLDGHGGPQCQWCPLCRLAGVLRGEHPEFTDRIAEAGGTVLAAFRALAEPAASGTGATRGTGAGPPPEPNPQPDLQPNPGRADERRRVERINLDDPDPTP